MARENGVLTQRWVDGNLHTTVIGGRTFVLVVDQVSAACRDFAMRHGLKQRTGDACAIERKDKVTGHLRSDAEMIALREARLGAIVDHLNSGAEHWELRQPGAGIDAGLTIMAIMRWKGCDVDAANGMVDKLATKRGIPRADALRAFAQSTQVIEAIAEIRAERAGVDADDLCAEIEEA